MKGEGRRKGGKRRREMKGEWRRGNKKGLKIPCRVGRVSG